MTVHSPAPPHAVEPSPPGVGAETEAFRPRVLGWSMGLLFAPVLAGVYLLLVPEPPLPRWAGAALIAVDLLLAGVLMGRRGRNGIEFTTRGLRVTHDGGVDQLNWTEVRSAERVGMEDDVVLVTHAGTRIVVDLESYAAADRAAIWLRVRGFASPHAEAPKVG